MQTTNYPFFPTIAFSLLFSIFLVACDPTQERDEISNIAWQLIDGGALVIDVRTAKEYAAGHIETAANIPYENLSELKKLIGTDKSRPVVLYCRSGRRSGIATEALTKEGYSHIFNGMGFQKLQAAHK